MIAPTTHRRAARPRRRRWREPLAPRHGIDPIGARATGAEISTTLTFERAGGDRPVCFAELLIRVRS